MSENKATYQISTVEEILSKDLSLQIANITRQKAHLQAANKSLTKELERMRESQIELEKENKELKEQINKENADNAK